MATINDKEAWLAERRTGLGGSDIAKICGLSKWGSAVDVYMDKKGIGKPVAETLRMRLGTVLEPFVTDLFIEQTGKRCIEYRNTIHGEGERACCLANLDRVVVEPHQDINEMVAKLSAGDLSCIESILECKTCVRLDDWYDENGNMTVPEYYKTQIYWYLGLVPSAKRIYVATLCTGLDCSFDFICVERSEKTVDGLMAYGVQWWKDHIEATDEEAVMQKLVAEAPSTKEVVAIYPRSNPASEFVLADKDLAAKFAQYKALQGEITAFETAIVADGKTREELMESLKTDITKEMQDKEVLVADDAAHTVLATFKSGNDTVKDVTDWEAVAKSLAAKIGDNGDSLKAAVDANTKIGVVTRKGARPFKLKAEKKAGAAGGKKGGKKAA